MPRIDIDQLPDTSRLFIYHTERPLGADEESQLRTELEGFLDQWAAHGSALTVGYEVREERFIVIAVDDSKVGPSGCSIDASTQFLRAYSRQSGIEILNAPEVCFRTDGGIGCDNRAGFTRLVESGRVGASTLVFDETISTLDELRAGRFEVPAAESWHGRAWDLRAAGAVR